MTVENEDMSGVEVQAGAFDALAKGVIVERGTFRCRRGYDLHTLTYRPAVRRTSACLMFHHGLADHSERHGRVLSHLCAALGMPVYTYDAHGHGRSGPHGPVGRALIASHRHLVHDLLDFARSFVTRAEEEQAEGGSAGDSGEQGAATGLSPAQAAAGVGSPQQQHQQQYSGAQRGVGREVRRGRPRIFLLGYSMGGLVSSLAVAETCPGGSAASAPTSTSPPCPAPVPSSISSPAAAGDGTSPSPPKLAPAGAYMAGAACTTAAAAADGPGSDANSSCSGSGSSVFEGLMLTSCLTDPLYGNHPVLRAIKVAYVTALSWLAPALPMFKRNPVESGIRDPAAAAAMADDRLWYRGKFKVATVASLLAGCAHLRRNARRLSAVPLYVQHATVDMSCSLPSMRAHLARVRPADLTLHVAEGAFHDLHHDPETPQLLGYMTDWLRKRV